MRHAASARALADPEFGDVLVAAQADAPWAYERLFTALASAVAGYLRVQGAQDPNGLANEVFLKVFSRLGSFEGDAAAFRSWVFTIAHNLLVDERRRRRRRVPETELTAAHDRQSPLPATEEHALAAVGEQQVLTLLATLPQKQRDVLVLRVVADLTAPQIAEALRMTVGGVKALQRRGLARLRRELDRAGGYPNAPA